VKKLIVAVMMLVGMAGMADAKKKKPVAAPLPVAAMVPKAEPENTLVMTLSTGGPIRIQLRPDKAPGHVARIKLLARSGFYDGIVFHRVMDSPISIAQAGDPQGTGEGGSPLPDLKAEFNDMPHLRGAISAARTAEPDTANSQFFICFQPSMQLDNKYTVFGRVISGMQYVDAIERGEPPANPTKIVRAWVEADGPNAPRVPLVIPAPVAKPAPAPVEAVPPKP
jgi:cyclophilin family peptidyl-prolyl cis-trans isomerase